MRKTLALAICWLLFVSAITFASVDVNDKESTFSLQLPGEHSTLTTHDGSIRDDELAKYIGEQIPKNEKGEPQVKDVKIFFNSCFGGGMLDDFQKIFGKGGTCEGVPWIFGSASKEDETAKGWSDSTVKNHPDKNLGSCWTDALAGKQCSPTDASKGAILDRTSDNVKDDLEWAKEHDDSGPKHDNHEHPVIAYGNGGDKIKWNGAKKHRAVVFGGDNTDLRHDNNIENVGNALTKIWSDAEYTIYYGWGDETTGTKKYLKKIIKEVCSELDKDTELVLYFDDHGDTEFDFDEFMEWLLPHSFVNDTSITFNLHSGWVNGFTAMQNQMDEISPYLHINLTGYIIGEEWNIYLNDAIIMLPEGKVDGELKLSIDWRTIREGENILTISPVGEPTMPMTINNLELCSGPINEVEKDTSASPEISIIHPADRYVYFFGLPVIPFPSDYEPEMHFSLIIGPAFIMAKAYSDVGIEKVDFYIDESLIHSSKIAPHIYFWNPPSGMSWHEIRVVAYAKDGVVSTDSRSIASIGFV